MADKTSIPIRVQDGAETTLDAGVNASATSIPLVTGGVAALKIDHDTDGSALVNGTATSAGDGTTLNSTGIQAALSAKGLGVGDRIYNVTQGRWAVIKTTATNSVTTTKLDDSGTWANNDKWCVNPYVIFLNTRTGTTVNTSEKVLITGVNGDTLECESGNRGYDNTTAQSFVAGAYVSIFVTETERRNVWDAITNLFQKVTALYNDAVTVAGAWTFSTVPSASQDPSSGDHLTRRSWVENNAGGGGEVTANSGEAISVNDAIFMGGNGKWLKAEGGDTTIGGAEELKAMTATNCRLCDLGGGKFAAVYSDRSSLYARAFTVDSAGNYTLGTEVTILSSTTHFNVNAIELQDDEFIIVWNQSGTHKFVVCTTSGTTITAGSTQNGHSGFRTSTHNSYPLDICRLSSTKVVVACANTSDHMTFYHVDISSGTISTGNKTTPWSSSAAYWSIACGRINDDTVAVQCYYSSGGAFTRVWAYDVTTATPTAKVSAYNVGDNSAAGSLIMEFKENIFMSVGRYQSRLIEYNTVSESFTILDSGAGGTSETDQNMSERYQTKKMRDGVCVQGYGNGAYVWTMDSANDVTKVGVSATNADDSTGIGIFDAKHFLTLSNDSGDDPNAELHRTDTTSQGQFLAKATVAADVQLTGVGIGGVLTTESGLTPGQPYIKNNQTWGLATAATDVFITRNPYE